MWRTLASVDATRREWAAKTPPFTPRTDGWMAASKITLAAGLPSVSSGKSNFLPPPQEGQGGVAPSLLVPDTPSLRQRFDVDET
jgi:hypothetical protein